MNTSSYRACKQCGEYFHADQDWKYICIGCFKENKRKDREREAYREANKHNQQRQHQRTYQAPPAPAIPPDMLRILIRLCHPDVHGGKPMATEATQWLLKQREISNV